LVISVLCLPTQILLYIWDQERDSIRVAISVVGVFAMLPLLHFFPIFWRGMGAQGKCDSPRSPRDSRWGGPNSDVLHAPLSRPPPIYTAHPSFQMSY
jgi:hypothetical protein